MANKGGKAPEAGGEEGKEGEDNAEPEKGCCDKYAECIIVTGKVLKFIIDKRQSMFVLLLCAVPLELV